MATLMVHEWDDSPCEHDVESEHDICSAGLRVYEADIGIDDLDDTTMFEPPC
jgi:hypothetical protein